MAMSFRELYAMLREQIRDHYTMLGAMRALARATLAAGAVVLGIMIVSLGSLVTLVSNGRQTGVVRVRTRPLRAWSFIVKTCAGSCLGCPSRPARLLRAGLP